MAGSGRKYGTLEAQSDELENVEEEIFTWDHLATTEPSELWVSQNPKNGKFQSAIWTSTLAVLSISLVAILLLAGNSGGDGSSGGGGGVAGGASSIINSVTGVVTGASTGGGTYVNLPSNVFEAGFTQAIASEMMTVRSSNEYGEWKAAKDYPWMKDVEGTQLVEPYKKTLLELSGPAVEENEGFHYIWEIPGYNGDLSSKSSKIELMFTEIGIYTLTVYVMDTSSKAKYAYTTRLVCKYVKRELRALTLEDKERFLDAARELWFNRQDEGVAKYGPTFTSIDVLVAVHSLASNDVMCDGFHEGTGFISHHLALTNTFEQSLRAVDPSVTLPYWDFTIEGEAIKKAGKRPSYMLEITKVFQDDWFGDSDPVTNRIVTGRWAGAKMPKQHDMSLGVQNSYGFIRSYWNNNPDDEISRRLFDACGVEPIHKQIPNCQVRDGTVGAPMRTGPTAAAPLTAPAHAHDNAHARLVCAAGLPPPMYP